MTTHRLAQASYRPGQDFLPPPVSLTVTPAAPGPGEAVTLTATLRNTTGITLRGTVLYLAVGATSRSRTAWAVLRPDGRSPAAGRLGSPTMPRAASSAPPTRSSTSTGTAPTAPAPPRC